MNEEVLIRLLRDEAPSPRAEFADALDRRVARGFGSELLTGPRADPIWPWTSALVRWFGGSPLRVAGRSALAAAAIALVAVGVSSMGTSRTESAKTRTPDPFGELRPDAYEAEPLSGRLGSSRSQGRSSTAVSGTVTDFRRHLLGSGMFLEVDPKQVPDVVADAIDVARDLDGYEGASSFDVEEAHATGSADLWVPTPSYAVAVARLSKLGRVDRITQASRDITGTRADLVAQIREDAVHVRSLGQSSNPSAASLAQRDALRTQLELRRQRLADLDRRVDMTLINVRVTGVHTTAKPPARWTVDWAVDTSRGLVQRTAAILIVTVAVLLVPALLFGIVWLLVRLHRRRWRRRTLDDI